MSFETPILLLIFNRPDTTLHVFNSIKSIKPKKLFIAADGYRSNKPAEKQLCEQAIEIATNVTWNCEVKTLFRNENVGCKAAVRESVDWFFSSVEAGIILEDDCVPDISFYRYCEILLKEYELNESIGIIAGTNYLFNKENKLKSEYFVSSLMPIWGWATWRNRWEKIDWNITEKQVNSVVEHGVFSKRFPVDEFRKWNIEMINGVITGSLDAWSLYMMFYFISNNIFSIVPKYNLIANIGEVGLHSTKKASAFINMPTKPINVQNIPSSNFELLLNEELSNKMMLNIVKGREKQKIKQNKITMFANKVRDKITKELKKYAR